jgi:hypothetical protein
LKNLKEDIIKNAKKSNDVNKISNNLTSQKYNEIDKNTNEVVEKITYLDDNKNIVNETDIEFKTETQIDEYGIKQTKNIPRIRRES